MDVLLVNNICNAKRANNPENIYIRMRQVVKLETSKFLVEMNMSYEI